MAGDKGRRQSTLKTDKGTMMRKNSVALVVALLGLGLTLGACQKKDDTANKAGNAADTAGDAAKDAGDKVGDAADKAGDAADKAGDAAGG